MGETGQHTYDLGLTWEGNRGQGTSEYAGYGRGYRLRAQGKPDLEGSADPAFLGEASRYNPEELLLGALAACHMLSFLALCARRGIAVVHYEDTPRGTLALRKDGGGAFAEVTLRPRVTLAPGSDPTEAAALHAHANARCFIASSCRFPVRHEALVEVAR